MWRCASSETTQLKASEMLERPLAVPAPVASAAGQLATCSLSTRVKMRRHGTLTSDMRRLPHVASDPVIFP